MRHLRNIKRVPFSIVALTDIPSHNQDQVGQYISKLWAKAATERYRDIELVTMALEHYRTLVRRWQSLMDEVLAREHAGGAIQLTHYQLEYNRIMSIIM
jgi:hypothetical protein